MLIVWIFLPSGIILQKILFLVWALGLFYSSFLEKNWIFMYLQLVASLWALLSFFVIDPIYKFILLWLVWIIVMFYIFRKKLFQKEKYWIFGIVWLTFLALWYASNWTENLVLFFGCMWLWALFMCIYAAFPIYLKKDKLSIIFFVLNVFFFINPAISLWKIYFA